MSITTTTTDELVPAPLLAVIRALAELQQYTTAQITIPGPNDLTAARARDIVRTACLVRAGTLTEQWHPFEIQPRDPQAPPPPAPEPGTAWEVHRSLDRVINGIHVPLGHERVVLHSARLEEHPSPTGPVYVLTPADNDMCVSTHDPAPLGPGTGPP